jgi:hypothetical protein
VDFKEYSAAFHDYQNSLMHYGIKGMRWGIRRYQNEDGSLTPLGKKRYSEEEDLINFHYEHQIHKADKKLNKINKKLSKDPNNKKLNNKKKLTEKEKEAYKKLAKAEIEKMYKSSYKDVLKKKDKNRDMYWLKSMLLPRMVLQDVPELYNDWSVLSKKERLNIINDVMKNNSKFDNKRIYYNTGRSSYNFKPYRKKSSK